MKIQRQAKILELIEQSPIETQEELTEKLREAGFPSTQATISRDIKELKLIKISCGGGTYKYAVNLYDDESKATAKFRNILSETIRKVSLSGTLAIVKTYSGMANAAAAAIDAMDWDGVLGTIAGDDTIFVAFVDNEPAVRFKGKIHDLIG